MTGTLSKDAAKLTHALNDCFAQVIAYEKAETKRQNRTANIVIAFVAAAGIGALCFGLSAGTDSVHNHPPKTFAPKSVPSVSP